MGRSTGSAIDLQRPNEDKPVEGMEGNGAQRPDANEDAKESTVVSAAESYIDSDKSGSHLEDKSVEQLADLIDADDTVESLKSRIRAEKKKKIREYNRQLVEVRM